jgi:ElaA protein
MLSLSWHLSSFDALTPQQIYAILAARNAVFVVEQTCPYQDMDGLDAGAMHLTAWHGTEVAAYLRIIDPGIKFAERSIGRVLTTSAFRGTGLGRELLKRALEYVDQTFPKESVRLGAQAHLQSFYAFFGFEKASDLYMEDGIPHVEMLRVARGAEV